MTAIRAACVQMRSGTTHAANIATLRDLVAEAADAGATYVQSPEMTGFVQRQRKALFETVKSEGEDPVVAAASELASHHGIFLHIGSTAILRPDSKVANRAFLFSPSGELLARYDKIHTFDVDLDNGERWRESAIYEPGKEAVIASMGAARLGLSICYDVRFPALADSYGKAGADIITFPACFTRQTGRAHWHTLLRSRAIENGAFVIAAAQGGDHADGRETFGHSLIVNPWGEIIAEVDSEEPGICIADINLEEVSAARGKVPNLQNQRAFTLKTGEEPVKRSA